MRTLTLALLTDAHHGVAGPAHRLVEADLARADHVRRCRRVRVLQWAPELGTLGGLAVAVAVRGPVRRRDGAARAAPAGPVPRARDDGVRADGGDPVLPATRDPRVRRQADPFAAHPRLRLQPAVRLPRHPLRPGRRHDALHRLRARRRRCPRRVAAQERVRSPAHRAGRQPGGVRDPRRQPDRHQARRVRDLGRHRRLRRCAARRVPGHRRRSRTSRCSPASPTCCCSWSVVSRS